MPPAPKEPLASRPPLPLPATLRRALRATRAALRRSDQAIARRQAALARTDTRDWAQARRLRTRHLIELGGLIQKAGLVELLEDDRATLLGALLHVAAQLQGHGDDDPTHLRARWRRMGLRAFAAERETEGNHCAAQGDGTPDQDRFAP